METTGVARGFQSPGQATARAVALEASRRGRLGRTFLVVGPAGAGKGSFVDDLLALLFCTDADPSARPCNACAGCRQGRGRRHPDLLVGSPDRWRELRGAGESLVATARQWLGEAAGAPIAGARRVVLIEGVDRAGEPIQNALLKALEEPSDRHVFVLVADDPSRLLPTVRSRCQPLRVGPVPRDELREWLVNRELLPRDQADALARLSDGLIGRAVALAREPDRLAWRRRVQLELAGLLGRGPAERLASVRELLDEASRRAPGQSADETSASAPESAEEPGAADLARAPTSVQRAGALLIVEAWLRLARDLLVIAAGRPEAAPTIELVPDLVALGERLDRERLAAFIGLLERIEDGLAVNASPRLALDVAALAWPVVPRS